jgi:hypothetical protein
MIAQHAQQLREGLQAAVQVGLHLAPAALPVGGTGLTAVASALLLRLRLWAQGLLQVMQANMQTAQRQADLAQKGSKFGIRMG